MDPTKLETAITSLETLANDSDAAKGDIDSQFEAEHDPIDISTFTTNAANASSTLLNRATEIRNCKNNIVQLNQSGVASADASGVISYTSPTDVNTPEDLKSAAQAAKDAGDLQRAMDPGKKGLPDRSYDEIVASIKASQGNAAYANAFIDKVGPENLTSLPMKMNPGYSRELCADPDGAPSDLAATFGTLLATASQTWDDKRSAEVSDAIVGSVDETKEYGRLTVLNQMLGGHDADGNYVNDLTFSKRFLLDMGERLEKLDYKEIRAYELEGKGHVGPYLDGTTFDPMAGVLDAMGNNPDAALDFLAKPGAVPDGSRSGGDMSRLYDLSKREMGDQGFAGLTAAIAAGASKRSSEDSTEVNRADDLSGHAIHYLALNAKEDLYNNSSKVHVAMLLADCSAEVTGVWNDGENVQNPDTAKLLPGASKEDINALGYHVADNVDATATISNGIADEARKRSQEGVQAHEGDPSGQRRAINAAYMQGDKAVGFLAGLADGKADAVNEKNDEKYAAKTASATAAVNVFTTAATTGLGAIGGPVGTAVASGPGQVVKSAATTYLNPVIVNKLAGSKDKHMTSAMDATADDGIKIAAIQDAANAGLLNESDFSVPGSEKYDWIKERENGTHYVDLSKVSADRRNEVIDWCNTINSPTQNGDPGLDEVQKDFNGVYSDGRTKGGDAANKFK